MNCIIIVYNCVVIASVNEIGKFSVNIIHDEY